jgi:hypothetical protein
MIITLSQPTEKIVVQEVKKSITTLTVQRMVDLPAKKEVRVFVRELNEPIILWSGATYDAAGQWTDVDVQNKLTSLFSGATSTSGTTV